MPAIPSKHDAGREDKNLTMKKSLKENGVLDNTIILFVGDNGTNSGVHTPMKDGRVIQGGKRRTTRNDTSVSMIVRWGDKIKKPCQDIKIKN